MPKCRRSLISSSAMTSAITAYPTHIGKQVEVQYNKHIVEIYYDHTRLASHQRSQGKGHYITDMKHMPSSHQVYNDWSLEYFVKRSTPILSPISSDLSTNITIQNKLTNRHKESLHLENIRAMNA